MKYLSLLLLCGVVFATTSQIQLHISVAHDVSLSWNAAQPGGDTNPVDHYNVYRSTVTGGYYGQIGSTAGLAYTDNTVSSSTTYYYVVTAVDSEGNESVNSNEASASIP